MLSRGCPPQRYQGFCGDFTYCVPKVTFYRLWLAIQQFCQRRIRPSLIASGIGEQRETVVLGGVFKNEDLTKGWKRYRAGRYPLPRNAVQEYSDIRQKSETLIFITPRILSEALVN
ncbi:MAG: hypothetical protein CM15mP74_15570 [Halieaceae bacterium]|nr:MAG: hypothetical protein CM15mP74_15570 [Halieaceae bacterium]